MKKYIAWLRKLILLSCMIMLICPSLNAETADSWKQTDFGGSPGEFASVVFLDANTLVGGSTGYNLNDGALYVSSDGGTTWLKKIEGKANISKVKNAAGTQTVYAVGGAEGYGYTGYLGKTTDGGSTWADLSAAFFAARKTILKLDVAYELPLYGLAVLDANTLLISGGYGGGNPEVWVSADGGITWSSAGVIHLDWTTGSETGYALQGTMQFVSTTTGFAASENNLFRTTDGVTWEKLSAPWSRKINEGYNLGTLTFLDAGNGWALVYDNTLSANSPSYGTEIYKTGNGGTSWTLVYQWSFTSSQSEDSPLSFYTDNGVEMWGGSWHKIWHSTDSGSSWTLDYDNANDGYVCVRSFKTAGNDPVPRAMYSIGMTGSYISGYYTRDGGSVVTTTTTTATGSSDLMSLNEWDIYGSASLSGTSLQFGDYVGYDPQDKDSDGNPENTWMTGSPGGNQGTDYDWAVSKKAFYPPLTITWSGCFPATSNGYNSALLAARNTAFTGQPNSGQNVIDWSRVCGFHTNWQNLGKLLTYTKTYSGQAQLIPLTGVAPDTTGDFCGDFKVVWDGTTVTYYYDGQKVDEKSLERYEPVYIFFRSFERPFTVNSISMTSGGGTATTTTTPGETTTTTAPVTTTTTTPGETTTTTVPVTTTTTTISCPVVVSVEDAGALQLLRQLRDRMKANEYARQIIADYYANAPEMSALLAESPLLKAKFRQVTIKNLGVASMMLSNGSATVRQKNINEIMQLLGDLKSAGSARLQRFISVLESDIKTGNAFNKIGIKIE